MRTKSVQRRRQKAAQPVSNGNVTPPRAPLCVWVDGEFNGPDLIKRLDAGGLELRTSDDGRMVALVKSKYPDAVPVRGIRAELFPKLRKQIFEVDSVVYAVRFALESCDYVELDAPRLANGLEMVGRILNDVVGELEPRTVALVDQPEGDRHG